MFIYIYVSPLTTISLDSKFVLETWNSNTYLERTMLVVLTTRKNDYSILKLNHMRELSNTISYNLFYFLFLLGHYFDLDSEIHWCENLMVLVPKLSHPRYQIIQVLLLPHSNCWVYSWFDINLFILLCSIRAYSSSSELFWSINDVIVPEDLPLEQSIIIKNLNVWINQNVIHDCQRLSVTINV